MAVEAKVRRIGGSTFALLSPDLVKSLGLHDGDTVILEVTKRGKSIGEILEHMASLPRGRLPPITEEDLDFEGDRWERLERILDGKRP
jgi:hypothetical protein